MHFDQKKEIMFSNDVQHLIGFVLKFDELSERGVCLMTVREVEIMRELAEKLKSIAE